MDNLSWRRQDARGTFLVSTRRNLLDRHFINTAFSGHEMHWATTLSPTDLETVIDTSITFGVYKVTPAAPPPSTTESPSSPRTPSPSVVDDISNDDHLEQVGMARLITDQVTTVFLTDVYVHPDARKYGLGSWMVACVKEVVDSHAALRRLMLCASTHKGKPYYAKALDTWDIAEEKDSTVIMTRSTFGKHH